MANGSVVNIALPLLFVFLWSGAFIAVRLGIPDISPITFLAARFTLAGLILLPITFFSGAWGGWRDAARVWPHLVVAGILLNGAYLTAGYWALMDISAATMALIGSLQPLMTAFLSGPVLGDRFRPKQWLGFFLGTAGVALVAGINIVDLNHTEGVLWGVGGSACFIAGTLYYARFCKPSSLITANCVQLTTAAIFCWLVVLAFEEVNVAVTPTLIWSFLYLTLGVSLGGMGLYLYMLKTGTAGKVAANFYITPGLTALLGWLILGETLSLNVLAGFALAIVGLWMVHRRELT
ncbi:MAG: DMT family transporter [Pseudomonadota bacterium]|nr:DMT family transporter [Pseudomonadota bacterium]